MSIPWTDLPLVALDLETTSADPEQARIVQACIGYSEKPGHFDPAEWLVNPGVPIPEGATLVHGITDEKAADGDDPHTALSQMLKHLEGCANDATPIVGHNLTYDLTVLDREFRRHMVGELPAGLIALDTLVLFRRFDLTVGGRRLEDLATRNGIQFPAHDATADALASLRLLHILASDNDLLPLVDPADLHDLQVRWHAAHQEAARSRRLGHGQSADGFILDWPLVPWRAEQ